jgi:hypothetical protein
MISPWMPFYSVLLKTMSVIDCQGNDKRRMCGSWPRSLLNLKLTDPALSRWYGFEHAICLSSSAHSTHMMDQL